MNTTKVLTALTMSNFILLALLLVHELAPAKAQDAAQILRGRALEIVDSQGRVRASISLHPAERAADGTQQAESVLLRLITERGRPSVKIGASEPASGLSFAGPTGTKDTWLILEARERSTSLRLRNEEGKEQIVRP